MFGDGRVNLRITTFTLLWRNCRQNVVNATCRSNFGPTASAGDMTVHNKLLLEVSLDRSENCLYIGSVRFVGKGG